MPTNISIAIVVAFMIMLFVPIVSKADRPTSVEGRELSRMIEMERAALRARVIEESKRERRRNKLESERERRYQVRKYRRKLRREHDRNVPKR